MKILFNVFHPNLEQSKVNRRWLKELEGHADVTINLAYALYHDWNIDIKREQEFLLQHDRVVFQHPMYWYSVPPLMKKWMDDVLTYGWAYGPDGTKLKGKEWVSAISSGGPAESYQAGGYNNFSASEFLKPLQQTANLIGMKFLPAFVVHGVVQASAAQIDLSAAQYRQHVLNEALDPSVQHRKLLSELKTAGIKLEA